MRKDEERREILVEKWRDIKGVAIKKECSKQKIRVIYSELESKVAKMVMRLKPFTLATFATTPRLLKKTLFVPASATKTDEVKIV